MSESDSITQEARGLSAVQLVLIFLGGVAVCALFFSAGFLVGYNERLSKAPPVAEQVSPPSEIPPVVAQPASGATSQAATAQPSGGADQPASSTPEAGTTEVTHPEPLRPQALSPSPSANPTPALTTPRATAAQAPAAPPTPPASPNSSATQKPPSRAESSSLVQASGTQGGNFLIQVAATGNKHDADKIVAALKALEYPVALVTPEQANAGDSLYRVQVGPFVTRESAERIRDKLIQDGFKSPFIKQSGIRN